MRETYKYILLFEWSSFVDIVDFIEVVVAAVGPEPNGEEGNGAGFTDSNGTGKGI